MFFDVISIEDPIIRKCLFAIKLLAQQRISKPPHITVRGPSARPTSESERTRLSNQLISNELRFKDFGIFNNDRTVIFLSFDEGKLGQVWHKPSYPVEKFGINVHITIYDGNDREFAESLYELCKQFNKFSFTIKADTLESFGPNLDYSLAQKDALGMVFSDQVIDLHAAGKRLVNLSQEIRIAKIRSILSLLETHVSSKLGSKLSLKSTESGRIANI